MRGGRDGHARAGRGSRCGRRGLQCVVAALGRVQARFHLGRRPRDRRRLGRFTHGIGGQAYGLFFALVANDRRMFDTILAWTENNLAQGDLSAHLPAWLWGRAPDGAWRVLDANAASDADLWIAYALVEAGRLWHERSYTARGALLAKRVLDVETATVPGLGLTLLPGPTGFKLADGQWRVNPSYSPPQVIRALGARLPDDKRWAALVSSTGRVLLDTAPKGFSPDWALYRAGTGFGPIATRMRRARTTRSACICGPACSTAPIRSPRRCSRVLRRSPTISPRMARRRRRSTRRPASPGRTTATAASRRRPCRSSTRAASVRWPMPGGACRYARAPVAARLLHERADAVRLGWRDGRYRFGADGTLDTRWEAARAPPAEARRAARRGIRMARVVGARRRRAPPRTRRWRTPQRRRLPRPPMRSVCSTPRGCGASSIATTSRATRCARAADRAGRSRAAGRTSARAVAARRRERRAGVARALAGAVAERPPRGGWLTNTASRRAGAARWHRSACSRAAAARTKRPGGSSRCFRTARRRCARRRVLPDRVECAGRTRAGDRRAAPRGRGRSAGHERDDGARAAPEPACRHAAGGEPDRLGAREARRRRPYGGDGAVAARAAVGRQRSRVSRCTACVSRARAGRYRIRRPRRGTGSPARRAAPARTQSRLHRAAARPAGARAR